MYDNFGKSMGHAIVFATWLLLIVMAGCAGFLCFVAYRVLF